MTDTSMMYRRLSQQLNKTRKTLTQVCSELDIDLDDVEDDLLQASIDQCSHCNIWAKALQDDLDGNPICNLCYRLVGA
jgi:hypothetical protein